MGTVEVIRKYFEADGGRKVTLEEFRALNKSEREELADLSAKAMSLVKNLVDGKSTFDLAA